MVTFHEVSSDSRTRYVRSGKRLNSRVAVAVEWKEDGRDLCVEGYTADISPKGCLAVVPKEFPIGQRLWLVNRINGKRCEVVLVWRGHEGRTGWELGLELQAPPTEFWDVVF